MQASILNNPRPSSGYNAVLGNIPASAPPSATQLAQLTPSVQNNVKEPMVNAVASYPILAQPYSNNMERYLHPGDLVFVYTKESAGNAGRERRGKPCVVANLPILNTILAGACECTNAEWQKPENWRWLGVMRNDMQLSEGALGVNHRYQKYRRLLNVDVRGATRVFNYWANARAGETVALRFVRCKRDGNYDNRDDNINAAVYNQNKEYDRSEGNKVPKQDFYWQCLPDSFAADGGANELENIYDMSNGGPHPADRAHTIHVGYCFQNIGRAEQVNDRATVVAASNFQDDRFRLPVIPMFIRT